MLSCVITQRPGNMSTIHDHLLPKVMTWTCDALRSLELGAKVSPPAVVWNWRSSLTLVEHQLESTASAAFMEKHNYTSSNKRKRAKNTDFSWLETQCSMLLPTTRKGVVRCLRMDTSFVRWQDECVQSDQLQSWQHVTTLAATTATILMNELKSPCHTTNYCQTSSSSRKVWDQR